MEYGHPHELLQLSEGYFSQMVAARGKLSSNELQERAKRSFFENYE